MSWDALNRSLLAGHPLLDSRFVDALLREIIRDSFSRLPGGTIEFYTNAGSDELAWATDQRWIEHVSLYRNRTVEQACLARQAVRNRGGNPSRLDSRSDTPL